MRRSVTTAVETASPPSEGGGRVRALVEAPPIGLEGVLGGGHTVVSHGLDSKLIFQQKV